MSAAVAVAIAVSICAVSLSCVDSTVPSRANAQLCRAVLLTGALQRVVPFPLLVLLADHAEKLFHGKPIRTISGVLELISRFEFEFQRCDFFFLNASIFWCVQSSITCNETVHVLVLWPVCAQRIPIRMLFCP